MNNMITNYWKIDGVNILFGTLDNAKDYIAFNYTPSELRRYLQYMDITCVERGKSVAYVRITIKNDKLHYSRPIPLYIINFR